MSIPICPIHNIEMRPTSEADMHSEGGTYELFFFCPEPACNQRYRKATEQHLTIDQLPSLSEPIKTSGLFS